MAGSEVASTLRRMAPVGTALSPSSQRGVLATLLAVPRGVPTFVQSPADLQEAVVGQEGEMGLAPVPRFLEVLLQLEPVASLHPAQVLCIVQDQLVQLHIPLQPEMEGSGCPSHTGDPQDTQRPTTVPWYPLG